MIYFVPDANRPYCKSSKDSFAFFIEAINNKKAGAVIGGSKHFAELGPRNLKLFQSLKFKKNVMVIPREDVDNAAKDLESIIVSKCNGCPSDCDDHHLFSLAKLGKTNYIISKDMRIASCRDKIRNKVGHKNCPKIKLVSDELAFATIIK